MSLLDLRRQSFRYTRLRNRVRGRQHAFPEPPARPIGVKLELTYACNLRCAFCYTDSPRRTLQRSIDLSDEAWRAIVDEAIELGILEAVVTGGEPLLRKELTLDLIERLAGEGIGIAFNTNGWFVDQEVADRLRGLPGVTVHLSLDGAAPHLHDAQRGVPGSWRRAVEGIDRLLSVGVGVCVVHVVTPENAAAFPRMLEQMWVLGVPWMRPTPVVVTGAAARGGEWKVSRAEMHRQAAEFERRRGTAMRVDLRGGTAETLADHDRRPPGSMLVRPNGAVRMSSLLPFSFGNAAGDGLASCWGRIREGWRDQRIMDWAESLQKSGDLPESDLVAYLDDEVVIGEGATPTEDPGSGRTAAVPEPAPLPDVDPGTDFEQAAELIRELALARRYRWAPVRSAGSEDPRIVRRTGDGGFLRLNRSAGMVMDILDGGSPGEAAEALGTRLGAASSTAWLDALGATRELAEKRVVVPAGADGDAMPADPGPSDLPGLEPVGEET